MRAVRSAGRRGRGRRGEGDPALGQDARPLPDPVLEIELPETRPVSRGREHERGAHEGACRIGLDDAAGHAERLEERAARKGEVVRLAAADRPAERPRDDVRGAARVVPLPSGRRGEPLARGEPRRVPRAEEHPEHVAQRVPVALGEPKAARHVQELAQRDGAAGVVGRAPLRHLERRVEGELAVPHEHPHESVDRALGHRPARQRGFTAVARGVALGDDFAVVDHDDGASAAGGDRAGLGERFVE